MALRVKLFSYKFDPSHDIKDVIRQYNQLTPTHSALKKLIAEFETSNKDKSPTEGDELMIPVLLPMCKMHQMGKFKLENVALKVEEPEIVDAEIPLENIVAPKPAVIPPKKQEVKIEPKLKPPVQLKPPVVENVSTELKPAPSGSDHETGPVVQSTHPKKKDLPQEPKPIFGEVQPKSTTLLAERVVESAPTPPPKKRGTNKYKAYPYLLGRPNETIQGVIKLYNDMSITKEMQGWLMEEFNKLNAENLPPKLGSQIQVPVLLPFCFRHEKNRSVFTDGK